MQTVLIYHNISGRNFEKHKIYIRHIYFKEQKLENIWLPKTVIQFFMNTYICSGKIDLEFSYTWF